MTCCRFDAHKHTTLTHFFGLLVRTW